MDKLITTHLGGMPFHLDDLRWQFEGIIDAMRGISIALGGANPDVGYIISGCEYEQTSPGVYTITDGYIAAAGEVWYYPGGTGIALTSLSRFAPNITWDSAGNKVFEDGSVHDLYMRRRARTIAVPLGGSGWMIPVLSAPRLKDRLLAILGPSEVVGPGPWVPLTLQNGWTNDTSGVVASVRLEPGGIVRLRGSLLGTDATSTSAAILPEAYRPPLTQRYTIHSVGSLGSTATIQIASTGAILILGVSEWTENAWYRLSTVPTFLAAE